MQLKFVPFDWQVADTLVVFSQKNTMLNTLLKQVDATTQGQLSRAIEFNRFTGDYGEILSISAPHNIAASCLLLVGLGDADELQTLKTQQLGGKVVAALERYGDARVTIAAPEDLILDIAYGARLRQHAFAHYQDHRSSELKPAQLSQRFANATSIESMSFLCEQPSLVEEKFSALQPLALSQCHVRDLVSEPPNKLTPKNYAERVKKLSAHGLEVEALSKAELETLGLRALLSVGQGSAQETCLVVMQWQGGNPADAPVALVGKGVTFDAGGIDLKPAKAMAQMKYDMAGSAAVVGTMEALARQETPLNVVGVIGIVENMPSSTALRPGDVITSLSGQTIEIVNTDAEGRLVLCDALWYTQERFKPRCIVDLATLTGAVTVALGQEYAGLFCNDDDLVQQLSVAGKACGEKVWPFPMDDVYDRLLDSDIADMKNATNAAPANSISAGKFLQRYIQDDVPWAHIDIANVAWQDKESDLCRKGATGFIAGAVEPSSPPTKSRHSGSIA